MERERQAQRQAISCQSCEVIREGFSSGTVIVQPGTRVSQLREVLVLYRKRELAMLVRGRGGIARFRYSDLKEAARVAADAGVMQI
jgi:hypothetical protein